MKMLVRELGILTVHTTDWVSNPFHSRRHHVFEKTAERHEVHLLRFVFYLIRRLETKTIVYEISDLRINKLAPYYAFNALEHLMAVHNIVYKNEKDTTVISSLLSGWASRAQRS